MQRCWGKSNVMRMKKAFAFSACLLFALTILYPAGIIVTARIGYRFELISVSAFAIALAVLSVCAIVLDLIGKNTLDNKVIQVLLAILTPLSFVNAILYIFACPQIWVIASVFLSAGCCCYLTVKHGQPISLKITALVLSATLILPVGFFSFIASILGNFGQDTVVKTVESPSGEYYAQVIDSDQGALGGDTHVDVYKKSGIGLILFKIEKKPQRVYFGDWGEFIDMQIYWKDDACLVINSVEYEIE